MKRRARQSLYAQGSPADLPGGEASGAGIL